MLVFIFMLLFLLVLVYHLVTYGRWAWRQGYRRGAVGIFIVAWFTLVLPVAVWVYHHRFR